MSLSARVPPELGGARLDVAVASSFVSLTRSQARRLIELGRVAVSGSLVLRPSARVQVGHTLDVTPLEPSPTTIRSEPIELSVVYEDDDVAVIDKPAGMVVHPAPGHASGTLVHAALHRFGELASPAGVSRAGIVHRLDKDTSGLLVIAKTESALVDLQRQFRLRRIEKGYLALVRGIPPADGIIDEPIGRDPRERKRMAITPNGRPAITTYVTLMRYRRHALLCVRPKTGRTHQIRVHLSALGTPVAGDRLYGADDPVGPARQFLHAATLGFDLADGATRVVCTSKLPEDLVQALAKVGDEQPARWAGVTGSWREAKSRASTTDELREPDAEEIQHGQDAGEDDR